MTPLTGQVATRWRIEEFRGTQGIRRLEPDWRRLVSAMPEAAPHHTYDNHLAYATHLGRADDLFCLALIDDHAIRAICPLERRTMRFMGFALRVWELPWDEHNLLRDIICPPDEARDIFLGAVVDYLRRRRDGSTWLVLNRVRANSAVARAIDSVPARDCVRHQAGASFEFDCTVPFAELHARLSKNFRANLKKAHNKLKAASGARFESVSDVAGLPRAFDTFLTVEASGWKGQRGAGTAIGLHQRLVGFYRDWLGVTGSPHAGGEINLLFADGRCIAGQLCIHTGGEYAIPKFGYEEAHARLAPGQLLLEETLRRCCEEPGVRRLSVVSDAGWFQDWCPEAVPVHCVYVAVGGWKGRVLLRLLQERFKYAPRIKRLLRRVASALGANRS